MNIKAIKTLPGYCERRTGNRSSSFSGLVTGIRRPSSLFTLFRTVVRSRLSERSGSSGVRLQSAFTLIELLITIVLVGIVLLALIMSFHESLKSLEIQKDLLSANLLSEDLMNEIRSKQFVQSHTNVGANRVHYEYVDDYNGLTDAPPRTIEGVILSNYIGFTRRVFVANVSNDFISPAPGSNAVFKRITVVVSNALMTISNVSVVSRYDKE